MEEKEYVALEEQNAVLMIPKNTIELEINATIYEDGNIQKVLCTYSMEEVRKAVHNAEEYYDDPDVRYMLTDAGKAFCEKLLEEEKRVQ